MEERRSRAGPGQVPEPPEEPQRGHPSGHPGILLYTPPPPSPETEIHGERTSIARRKVFACPESFCEGNFCLPISIGNCLESFRIVWKTSGLSGKILDCLEILHII